MARKRAKSIKVTLEEEVAAPPPAKALAARTSAAEPAKGMRTDIGVGKSMLTGLPEVVALPKIPKAMQPASLRFSAPESKLTTTAAIISKPTQSWMSWKSGVSLGPARPLRVRVVR